LEGLFHRRDARPAGKLSCAAVSAGSRQSMIPKSGHRLSEKDHAPTRS